MSKRSKQRRNYLLEGAEDGLLTHPIGPWAADKYRLMGMYAEMFSTGMKNIWGTRVYLDLFAGPGYSRIRESGQVVLGSPMISLSLPDPFNRYIFADENVDAIAALRQRVARMAPATDVQYVVGDANDRVHDIAGLIPTGGEKRGVLSFCFLDPYALNLHFETVRRLAAGRSIDFLILLALYVDARRNLELYIRDESDRIDRFLGDTGWRQRWQVSAREGTNFVAFLAREYSNQMASIGYRPMGLERMVKVRTHEHNLPLYYLAFFSKHNKGVEFWDEVLKYSNDQLLLL